MSGPVLVLNCGSSSVKYRLVQPASGESLADGVIEDIIAALSRHRWLFVVARNSSFTYKGRTVDVK